jgi:predicted metal-dependent phosphoesterase TrpH
MVKITDDAKFDLHIHTTESDGALDPFTISSAAEKGGLEAIAFTDHNTTRAFQKVAHLQNHVGLKIIPGVEISANQVANHQYKRLHFLAYGGSIENLKKLDDTLTDISLKNEMQLVNNVLEFRAKFNKNISDEFIGEIISSRATNRTKIAKKLVEAGYEPDEITAYRKLISVLTKETETYKFPAKTAIDVIRSHGMVPVLAHPKAILQTMENAQHITENPHVKMSTNWDKLSPNQTQKRLKELNIQIKNFNRKLAAPPQELGNLKQYEKVFHHRMQFETLIGKLKSMGLAGIEGLSSHYLNEDLQYFKWLANDIGLLNLGGSDFHNNQSQNKHIPPSIGSPHVKQKHMDLLFDAIESAAANPHPHEPMPVAISTESKPKIGKPISKRRENRKYNAARLKRFKEKQEKWDKRKLDRALKNAAREQTNV